MAGNGWFITDIQKRFNGRETKEYGILHYADGGPIIKRMVEIDRCSECGEILEPDSANANVGMHLNGCFH